MKEKTIVLLFFVIRLSGIGANLSSSDLLEVEKKLNELDARVHDLARSENPKQESKYNTIVLPKVEIHDHAKDSEVFGAGNKREIATLKTPRLPLEDQPSSGIHENKFSLKRGKKEDRNLIFSTGIGNPFESKFIHTSGYELSLEHERGPYLEVAHEINYKKFVVGVSAFFKHYSHRQLQDPSFGTFPARGGSGLFGIMLNTGLPYNLSERLELCLKYSTGFGYKNDSIKLMSVEMNESKLVLLHALRFELGYKISNSYEWGTFASLHGTTDSDKFSGLLSILFGVSLTKIF